MMLCIPSRFGSMRPYRSRIDNLPPTLTLTNVTSAGLLGRVRKAAWVLALDPRCVRKRSAAALDWRWAVGPNWQVSSNLNRAIIQNNLWRKIHRRSWRSQHSTNGSVFACALTQ